MSSRSTAARICGEQDCDCPRNRPNQPLCLKHYRMLQADDIGECPNCPGVYKPSEYPVCRECYRRGQQQPTGRQVRERREKYADDSKGWDLKPEPVPQAPAVVVEAINRVRENITTHRRACENHETNTVQYLIMPLLKGLGWDDHDPAQVVMEYKPAGRRHGRAIAVDVALMGNGSPVAFIEAKRLNREYTHDYMEQLSKYAAHLENGKTAVLTNGQFWIVCSVANGKPVHEDTVDVAAGKADDVAAKLHAIIGRSVVTNGGAPSSTKGATTHQATPDRETTIENLKRYRQSQPSYVRRTLNFVLTNEVISTSQTDAPPTFTS